MELVIRRAAEDELERVRRFYHEVTDGLEGAEFSPGWKKDIYPSVEDLRGALEKQQLYVGELGERLVAAMIVNHDSNEGYKGVAWPSAARDDEAILIHALGVMTECMRQGMGRKMVEKVMVLGRAEGCKALRLDVLAGNRPAERLYAGLGFVYVDSRQMYYADTGWTKYDLYEYAL